MSRSRPDRDAGDLARLLLGVTLGCACCLARTRRRSWLEGPVRAALALLDCRRDRAPGGGAKRQDNSKATGSEEDEMTRLTDLPPQWRAPCELAMPDLRQGPGCSWTRHVGGAGFAIVSSAGLVRARAESVSRRDPDYRRIPADTKPEELLISHISINFASHRFQEDWNVVFPLDRLSELARRRDRLGGGGTLLVHGPTDRSRWSRTPANWLAAWSATTSTPSSSLPFDRSARARERAGHYLRGRASPSVAISDSAADRDTKRHGAVGTVRLWAAVRPAEEPGVSRKRVILAALRLLEREIGPVIIKDFPMTTRARNRSGLASAACA